MTQAQILFLTQEEFDNRTSDILLWQSDYVIVDGKVLCDRWESVDKEGNHLNKRVQISLPIRKNVGKKNPKLMSEIATLFRKQTYE